MATAILGNRTLIALYLKVSKLCTVIETPRNHAGTIKFVHGTGKHKGTRKEVNKI